jgi:hypothetical protein
MKQRVFFRAILLLVIIVGLLVVQVSAQPPQGRGRGVFGDWLVKSDFNGMTMESILALSRDQDGNITGAWIGGFGGMNELKDVTFADGKLSFTQERQGRDGETMTSKFTGTITDGVLTGNMSSDWGDREMKATRMPRISRAVGDWQMKYSMGDREIVSTLKIRSDAEGNLTATWPSDMVEHKVTDIELNRRDLSFKRTTKMGDQEWQATFTGTLQGNEITGTFKSDRGDMESTGTLIGGDLIGTWNLDVSSDFGDRKNRLVVYPDMTARYGATLVKKVNLDGDKVLFKLEMGFGDRTFEMDFAGKIANGKLTGELTNDMGTQDVTGEKVVRRRGMRGG